MAVLEVKDKYTEYTMDTEATTFLCTPFVLTVLCCIQYVVSIGSHPVYMYMYLHMQKDVSNM